MEETYGIVKVLPRLELGLRIAGFRVRSADRYMIEPFTGSTLFLIKSFLSHLATLHISSAGRWRMRIEQYTDPTGSFLVIFLSIEF